MSDLSFSWVFGTRTAPHPPSKKKNKREILLSTSLALIKQNLAGKKSSHNRKWGRG